ncbi:hypothetical protein RB2654_15225 [Rhodobacterales bacterium HTCC2654]|uniref:Uncharacterized protein n=1 Tax=Maritimibacter alkaliphilus HTCC2654 TaxID=314271 RepID=A3VH94_9RHOB|nr:hypothetical protein RB2654_15225 [Rhodobacterales bacterium HTCC2654] [Maritimibacter alkaliphilus HTCC2654]
MRDGIAGRKRLRSDAAPVDHTICRRCIERGPTDDFRGVPPVCGFPFFDCEIETIGADVLGADDLPFAAVVGLDLKQQDGCFVESLFEGDTVECVGRSGGEVRRADLKQAAIRKLPDAFFEGDQRHLFGSMGAIVTLGFIKVEAGTGRRDVGEFNRHHVPAHAAGERGEDHRIVEGRAALIADGLGLMIHAADALNRPDDVARIGFVLDDEFHIVDDRVVLTVAFHVDGNVEKAGFKRHAIGRNGGQDRIGGNGIPRPKRPVDHRPSFVDQAIGILVERRDVDAHPAEAAGKGRVAFPVEQVQGRRDDFAGVVLDVVAGVGRLGIFFERDFQPRQILPELVRGQTPARAGDQRIFRETGIFGFIGRAEAFEDVLVGISREQIVGPFERLAVGGGVPRLGETVLEVFGHEIQTGSRVHFGKRIAAEDRPDRVAAAIFVAVAHQNVVGVVDRRAARGEVDVAVGIEDEVARKRLTRPIEAVERRNPEQFGRIVRILDDVEGREPTDGRFVLIVFRADLIVRVVRNVVGDDQFGPRDREPAAF